MTTVLARPTASPYGCQGGFGDGSKDHKVLRRARSTTSERGGLGLSAREKAKENRWT